MNDYLSEAEKAAVISFRSNTVMLNAVKKVLLHTITNQGTYKKDSAPIETNWVFGIGAGQLGQIPTNEQMGEELKACLRGFSYLQDGFKKLNEVQIDVPKKEKKNPAL